MSDIDEEPREERDGNKEIYRDEYSFNHLKDFRLEHNLKQVQIPELLGYNLHTWRDYENGRRKVPAHVLKSIQMFTYIDYLEQRIYTT